MELDTSKLMCSDCRNIGLEDGNDGFFYCRVCGSRAEEVQDTGVADEDFIDKGAEPGAGGGGIYAASLRRSQASQTVIKAEPLSQVLPQNEFWANLTQEDGKNNGVCDSGNAEDGFDWDYFGTEPRDFGDANNGVGLGLDYEDYFSEVRLRYVMGLQLMVQFQCEALVREFGVSPVVCGLAGSVWLRFVSKSGVFDDEWAEQAVEDSEIMHEGEAAHFKTRPKYRKEPHNLHGRRAVMVWLRSLRKRIPIHCSLAVSFLICHIAREAILPADIVKWSREGKLPYFGAFVQIEKHIGGPSRACPIPITSMFRPIISVPVHMLEVLAARIADSIDLHLPPVNFYAIACRYLKELSVPMEEVLPNACRIYEWLIPPELWLSRNEYRFPTCLYVMSIIIVTIRSLYNIHGFGYWEKSLSNKLSMSPAPTAEVSSDSLPQRLHHLRAEDSGNLSHIKKSKLDAERLLHILEARYHELVDMKECSVDAPAFFQYCNNLAFAGVEIPYEDHEEVKLVKQLSEIYRHDQDCNSAGESEGPLGSYSGKKRFRADVGEDDDDKCFSKNNTESMEKKCRSDLSIDNRTSSDAASGQEYNRDSYSSQGDGDPGSFDLSLADSFKDSAIRKIKLNMEENRFTYIPPRVNLKRFDYLHYVRKKDDGAISYVAHADYYILLRACAKAAEVDVRIMHTAVLSFEKRLAWMEKRVNYCLHLRPLNISCKNCGDLGHEDALDSSVAFSRLNL